MPPVVGVVLAAGQGTRMKSALPKVLHQVCGLSMVEWVIDALRRGGVGRVIVVVGHGADLVKQRLAYQDVEFVTQTEQKGTGHAVMMAAPLLDGHTGLTVVSAGDTPLLTAQAISDLVAACTAGCAASLATATLDDAGSYGRIIRDPSGGFVGIKEAKDCTPDERKIQEWNPALYCFQTDELLASLPRLHSTNSQGEYYLTDVLGDLVSRGKMVTAKVEVDPHQFSGVNDRWQLSEVANIKRLQIIRHHAEQGVTVIDPPSTHIDAEVQIEPDAVIFPNTVINGPTVIATGAQVGPNTWIKSSRIGRGARVFMSHLDQATMGDGTRCGPFANLRPDAVLEDNAKIGNFVEIKNSVIGSGTSISHLTYIGDAVVGYDSNIGAGTITCNYDGYDKHRTSIGSRSFVGSNSTLIAPVTIGDDSFVAAGSVVSENVPEGAMAVGRSRQVTKPGWFTAWRLKKQGERE